MDKEINPISVKQWKVVYTKPRSEKRIAERLGERGFDVYCPMQTTLKQWSDRKKKVSIPIFTSYVFLRVTELETDAVLQDPAVLNFVYWLGKPAIIRDEEIDSIKMFLSENKDNALKVLNYSNGENVEIVHGPLKGYGGVVDKIKSGKLSLRIESLGMVVSVEVNQDRVSSRE